MFAQYSTNSMFTYSLLWLLCWLNRRRFNCILCCMYVYIFDKYLIHIVEHMIIGDGRLQQNIRTIPWGVRCALIISVLPKQLLCDNAVIFVLFEWSISQNCWALRCSFRPLLQLGCTWKRRFLYINSLPFSNFVDVNILALAYQ